MPLTEAQLKEIRKKLFLFKDPHPVRLPTPVNNPALAAIMDPVAKKPKFKDLSFAVVDFATTPHRVFLHNDDVFWRMGSSGKIAGLLAAAQLRDDVRKVKELGFLTTPAEFDDLFSSTIWSRSTVTHAWQIGGAASCPRISTTIDVGKSLPDFLGADVTFDRANPPPRTDDWDRMKDFSFRDRLWLMGSMSDNVASASCFSEIGLAYIKAVQRAYGLWNDAPKERMRMLVSSHYEEVKPGTPVSKAAGAKTFRAFRNEEYKDGVKDVYLDNSGMPHLTNQMGSVRAMAAYMIALINDGFLEKDISEAIKDFLSDGRDPTLPGSLAQGALAIAPTSKVHSKGGALNPNTKNPTVGPGAKLPLRSDLAFIESGAKKYAMVAQGLLPIEVGGAVVQPDVRGQELAQEIHKALP